MKVDDFLNIAIESAMLAGDFIISKLGKLSISDISQKQISDFVTKVDTESEKIIINTIRKKYPSHAFYTEESIKDRNSNSYRWIIDPLDGTTNYIHQYPVFSISIALEYKGKIILGVIYDPMRKEIFTAIKGKGSFLNGEKINVSKINNLKYSLITTGFPFRNKQFIEYYLKLFKNIFLEVSDIRRAGSAAIDLAYIACGRCDGFFEIGLSPWDIAAGSIIIKEAGGVITGFGGGNDFLFYGNIIAGNPYIHKELLKETKKIFTGIIDK
ncbi:MAG: inositol monophosphatase [Nitrospirae bacterium]|jgi:myo-inositol-1(or 4)-monophosphatase|nr:inositol monophosphatase [Nitrospirota bacterium]